MHKGEVFLSGRFLVNLIDDKYDNLKLTRIEEFPSEICRKRGFVQKDKSFDFIVYNNGRWVVTSYRHGYEYFENLNKLIVSYMAHILHKVKDEKIRKEIEATLLRSQFYSHESLIISLEALVSCAIKNPDNYPAMLKIFQSPRVKYRLHNQNAPYILLTSLYGNQASAEIISSSLTNQPGIYYFRKPNSYEDEVRAITNFTGCPDSVLKIEEQIKSLRIKSYDEYLDESRELPF